MKHAIPALRIVVGGLLAISSTACATTRDLDQLREDRQITRSINQKLLLDEDVSRFHVDVDTLENVVTLRGEVPDERARAAAEEVAMSTDGVIDVYDRLEVLRVDRETTRDGDPDAIMTSRIRTRIMLSPLIRSSNVDVDTIDGDVYLSGIVESEEARNAAASIAGIVPSTDEINNELRVGERVVP